MKSTAWMTGRRRLKTSLIPRIGWNIFDLLNPILQYKPALALLLLSVGK